MGMGRNISSHMKAYEVTRHYTVTVTTHDKVLANNKDHALKKAQTIPYRSEDVAKAITGQQCDSHEATEIPTSQLPKFSLILNPTAYEEEYMRRNAKANGMTYEEMLERRTEAITVGREYEYPFSG